MNTIKGYHLLFFIYSVLFAITSVAQENRAAYNFGVKNMYLNANFGMISYNYNEDLLLGGYTVESITEKRSFAGRFAVGYHLKNNWDIQFSVLRPGEWTHFNNVSYDKSYRTVWTNIWAFTGKKNFNALGKHNFYLEAGISNVARKGITIGSEAIVADAHYVYPLFGAGFNYRISDKFEVTINTTYSPPKSAINQPSTTLLAGGIIYSLKEPDQEVIQRNTTSPYYFPTQIIQLGYTTDFMGFGINRQFSEKIPMFWLGDVFVENGVFLAYQRNIFHTYKNFSFDIGASFANYTTRDGDSFHSLAVFPVVRWWFLRTKPVDLYFNYSLIGPAYLSQTILDTIDTGEQATFQDFMGIGFLLGEKRNINLDLKIAHYSNGNIFNENAGVAIPLTISFGYALY